MDESRGTKRNYGRNWKKWLLIYVAAGAVVYGVVYLILQSGSGGGIY
ncbi:MAG TPA: hypothetical protein VIE12_04240 [Actinomycetota bacterium]